MGEWGNGGTGHGRTGNGGMGKGEWGNGGMGERGNGEWGNEERGVTGESGNYELLIRNINHMYGEKRTEKGNRNSTG
jgi:hypothetical protein